MSFFLFTAFCALFIGVFSKPYGPPAAVKRQETATVAASTPQSTACGDLVVEANNGRDAIQSNARLR